MKALFFDIDGTLIDTATHRVPQSTITALGKAKKAGNRIFIATGRSHTIVQLPGLPDGMIDGYVTLNGAICLADDKFISLTKMPDSSVKELIEICTARRYTCLFVTLDGLRVANADRAFHTGFQEHFGLSPIPETDFKPMLASDIYQMTVFFSEEEEPELIQRFPALEFNRWFPTFADITAKGANKAFGIDTMARHFGIDRADTVAFGDGGNDIPMLRRAAIGVAMGNANDTVKANADIVTDRVDNDGIAKALERLKIIEP